ncbi:rCG46909 [Rattus norvegicus]|uniref:RCG46909 n=1 Tax=Rattus norvegicus TaxID=10116 RepID=A6IX36_RAT|nr:rCG46909 [Rattus norvegicus]
MWARALSYNCKLHDRGPCSIHHTHLIHTEIFRERSCIFNSLIFPSLFYKYSLSSYHCRQQAGLQDRTINNEGFMEQQSETD